MKKLLWAMVAVVSAMSASCQMDDFNVSDFLNGINVNTGGGDDTEPPPSPYCGDGRIDSGEDCDDGNTNWGDGCDPYCYVEYGWVCYDNASTCYYEGYCGDGIVQWERGEECEYGNYAYDTDTAWDGDTETDGYEDPGYDAGPDTDVDTDIDTDGGYWGCSSWCTYTYFTQCTYEGETYNYGDSWWVDNYTYCYCESGGEVTCYFEGWDK
jgi:cysteine-rich repeat protein